MNEKREDLPKDCRALAGLHSVLSCDVRVFYGHLLLRWLICPFVKTSSLFLQNRIYELHSTNVGIFKILNKLS